MPSPSVAGACGSSVQERLATRHHPYEDLGGETRRSGEDGHSGWDPRQQIPHSRLGATLLGYLDVSPVRRIEHRRVEDWPVQEEFPRGVADAAVLAGVVVLLLDHGDAAVDDLLGLPALEVEHRG